LLTCITAIDRCSRSIQWTFNAVVRRYFLLNIFTLSCSGFTFTCICEFAAYNQGKQSSLECYWRVNNGQNGEPLYWLSLAWQPRDIRSLSCKTDPCSCNNYRRLTQFLEHLLWITSYNAAFLILHLIVEALKHHDQLGMLASGLHLHFVPIFMFRGLVVGGSELDRLYNFSRLFW